LIVLEQYRIYVEMSDRVSSRRGIANTFFLTLNTLIFTVVGLFWQHRPTADEWLLALPAFVLVAQCVAWFWILRSHQQLNSAKFAVIGVLEENLPASPYWLGEWSALGKGADKRLYWPLTRLEQLIPLLFSMAYIIGFMLAVAT
jgi:hypothetical protein